MELPNNSEKALSVSRKPERQIEKIDGINARHRPTFGKMIRDSFVPQDVDNAGTYILSEMIVPGIRDGVFDIILGIIDYWRGGVGGYSRRSSRNNVGPGSRNHTDYNRASSGGSRFAQNYDSRPSGPISSYDDIFLADGEDRQGRFISGVCKAEMVIAQLKEDADQYGVARLSEMLQYCGLSSSPNGSDYNYGWVNLDQAGYRRIRGGAILILPKALPIEE